MEHSNWDSIRSHYPNRWLLLEATKARTEYNKRVLDELSVLESFDDSLTAMKQYKNLHHEAPERELYVFHTSRESLDIPERRWLGIRTAL